jgi:hypothetical protein
MNSLNFGKSPVKVTGLDSTLLPTLEQRFKLNVEPQAGPVAKASGGRIAGSNWSA